MLLVIEEPGSGETSRSCVTNHVKTSERALKIVFIRHRLIELLSIIFH